MLPDQTNPFKILAIIICCGIINFSQSSPAMAGDSLSDNSAKSGWYFAGKGGPSFASLSDVKSASSSQTLSEQNSSNMIGAFGMATGYEWMYKFKVPLRTELEFMNRTEVTYDASPLSLSGSSAALASTVQNITFMANNYWHFPIGSRNWWPFVSAGLGVAHNKTRSQYTPSGGSGTKYLSAQNNLAWSVGLGASLKMGPDMTNDIELRHIDFGSVDWGLPSQNIKTDDFAASELIFAIRYNF